MNHSARDPLSDPKAVNARIAETLAKHADPRFPLQIQAYARRHLPEHAAAGESMNEGIISRSILPYLDVTILKEVSSSAVLSLMPLVRKASYAWSWEHPGRNAAALRFIAAAERYDIGELDLLTPWRVTWAKSTVLSEILATIDSFVSLDAARAGGRIAVVTVARQGRTDQVDLWDLASGESRRLLSRPVGVSAVAIDSAPDGGAIVSIGTEGGLVLYWQMPGTGDRTAALPDAWRFGSFDIGDPVTALSVTSILNRPHLLAGQANGLVSLLDCVNGGLSASRAIHKGQVTGLTSIELDHGVPAAVSAGVDGTVRLSHLGASLPAIGAALRSGAAINAVAALRSASGKAVAVTAGNKGAVRIWDLTSESPSFRQVPGHDRDVVTVAAGTGPHGEALVVTGDSRGRLRFVDPDAASVVGVPIEGHGNRVTGLALERMKDGRSIAVSGGADGIVRSWDLAGTYRNATQDATSPTAWLAEEPSIRLWRLGDGRELGGDAGARSHQMAAVAVGDLADGVPIAVTDAGNGPRGALNGGAAFGVATAPLPAGGTVAVSASGDGGLRFWDLTPCPSLPPRLSHQGSHPGVQAVIAATRAGGNPVAVSAGQDRVLKIWDMRDGRQFGSDLTGHERTVTALAVAAAPDRTTVVVSGSADTSLRVWDLDVRRQAGNPFHGFQRRITALAAAWIGDSLIAVAACQGDPVVRWCDLLGAAPPRELVGHAGPVTAVAVIRSQQRPLVVTASEDRTVRIWDLMASAPFQIEHQDLDPMPVPGAVRAIACFNGPAPGAVIAGDDVLAVVRWGALGPNDI
jgi:WD40 repeat protein